MAASMLVFGDNGIGWRVPSVIAGLVSLVAVYGIVRSTNGGAWLGVLAVFFLAFDNLTLVHGRIGTLDMLVLAPILVASWLAVRRHWALAGLALAIGLLIKLTAIYALGAIILLFLLHVGPRWWRRRRIPLRDLRGPLVFLAVTGVVAIVGLALLDARFTTLRDTLRPHQADGRLRCGLACPRAERWHLPRGGQPALVVAVQRVPDPVPAR